jgi:hypothetical protein
MVEHNSYALKIKMLVLFDEYLIWKRQSPTWLWLAQLGYAKHTTIMQQFENCSIVLTGENFTHRWVGDKTIAWWKSRWGKNGNTSTSPVRVDVYHHLHEQILKK